MVRKAVFLDFDGTYAHLSVPPQAHIDAVLAVRKAGNPVFLCTGRPLAMIPAGVIEVMDGLVGSAGAYVRIGDDVLADRRFDPALGDRLVGVLMGLGAAFILEGPEKLYGPPSLVPALLDLRAKLGIPEENRNSGFERMILTEELSGIAFSKATVAHSTVSLPDIVAQVGDGVDWVGAAIPGVEAEGGEIFQAGISKATGMAIVCEALGIAQADTVAFGDGANDVEMLAWAGVGVAMAGSNPRALAVADRTTPGPQDAGLVSAFADLGLTSP